jgi:hypothetical protein
MAEVLFAEHRDMIKAIPSDRANEPFRMSVLPWRSCRGRPVTDVHCGNAPDEGMAISAVAIANEILRGFSPAAGFSQLTRNPFGGRMLGHTQPQQLSAGMPQDQKSIQQPKRDCWNHEHVHRCDAVGMIAKKGLPALGTAVAFSLSCILLR